MNTFSPDWQSGVRGEDSLGQNSDNEKLNSDCLYAKKCLKCKH